MTASDTICAAGMPKNVQLSSRRFSSTNRVTPYQMKKTRNRSPGRSRSRKRNPSQMRNDRAEDPGDRLVQEQRVEARGRFGEARARVRSCEPVGAVDRDAPRQGRRRAVQLLVEVVAPARDGLHHEQGWRDDVGPARERDALPARVPPGRQRAGGDPAVDAEPRIRRQDDLERVVRVQLPTGR